MKKYNLLLLTGTIKPHQYILGQGYKKTIDANERLGQYVESIKYYLNIPSVHGIVFVDNSDFSIPTEILGEINNLARSLGKDLEMLAFTGNHELQLKYTYGYGEFEILEYFLAHSQLLTKASCFYKITGRYIIQNIEEIITKTEDYENLVYKFNILDFDTLATSFFKLNKEGLMTVVDNYKKAFSSIGEAYCKYIGAENIFFSLLYGKFRLRTIRLYPRFHYLSKSKYCIYDSLLRLGILDPNSFILRILIKGYSRLSIQSRVSYLKKVSFLSQILFRVHTK